MSVIKYQRALAGVGGLLRSIRIKDLTHHRTEKTLTAREAKDLTTDIRRHGCVLTAADLEVLSIRFTAEARASVAAGEHNAGQAWDE